jgi:DNA transformation protein
MKSQGFVRFVLDQLEGAGAVHSRAMFGGHGIYLNGIIVALVVDEVLYLKADADTQPRFEAAGSAPFTYHNAKTGKVVAMSYWEAPAAVLDDPAQLQQWALDSAAVSGRAKRPAAKGGGKKKTAGG